MAPAPQPLTERFWSKVDRRGPDECWDWTAGLNAYGYGQMTVQTPWGHRPVGAHRIAYLLEHGAILSSDWVLHSCDNPPCCNPAHLRAGTPGDNFNDQRARSGRFQRTAPLTDDEVREIRRRAKTDPQKDLAREFSLNPGTVSQIVHFKRRGNVR